MEEQSGVVRKLEMLSDGGERGDGDEKRSSKIRETINEEKKRDRRSTLCLGLGLYCVEGGARPMLRAELV